MKSKNRFHIVVDASIARSAGGIESVHPLSSQCRELLLAILNICHHAAFSEELLQEWKNNRSNFARKWLTQMFARKKVRCIPMLPDHGLDQIIALLDDNSKAIAEKDLHLVKCGIAHDRIIISLDEKARSVFRQCLSNAENRIGHLLWINPTKDFDAVLSWLRVPDQASPSWALVGEFSQ